MKRISLLLLLFILSISLFAQEPGNNLGKTISQIQQEFPNLAFLRYDKGYQVYNSAGDDEDFTSFYFSNGRVVGEYTYIFEYASDGRFITDLYISLINRFAKYGARHNRSKSSSYDITYFYFPNFIVKFANYHTQLQIYYELNGYQINIDALHARPRY